MRSKSGAPRSTQVSIGPTCNAKNGYIHKEDTKAVLVPYDSVNPERPCGNIDVNCAP